LHRAAAFVALVKLFNEPQYLAERTEDDPHAGITQIDYEEQTAGYQAAYSRLASSESAEVDPVAYVKSPQEFVGEQLTRFCKSTSGGTTLISSGGPQVQPFVEALNRAGYLA
jgi:exportin-2 (importin alpha re-exporter)